jgi:hypothetical protein
MRDAGDGRCEVTARSETRKLARCVWRTAPRAAPLGEYGLGRGENGLRRRKWGDRWPILLTNLAQVREEGNVSRWLAGVVVLRGGWSCT